MTSVFAQLLRHLLVIAVYLLYARRNERVNCQKEHRHAQFFMPIGAFLYCLVMMFVATAISNKIFGFINAIPAFFNAMGAKIPFISSVAGVIAQAISRVLAMINLEYWVFFVSNIALLMLHVILKRICIAFSLSLLKNNDREKNFFTRAFFAVHDYFANLFYEYDDDKEEWYLKVEYSEARRYVSSLYIVSMVLSAIAMVYVAVMYRNHKLASLFYPVLTVIIFGEWKFLLDGLTRDERKVVFEGDDDFSRTISNYVGLRQVLRDLFGDKLASDNTSVSNSMSSTGPEALLASWEQEDMPVHEAYAHFIRKYQKRGNEIDHNYLVSGEKLLKGQSVLFNNPFYYDLIPYAFYSMNRALVQHKKVLVVLGRHGIEDDIHAWLEKGFEAVNNLPSFWRIGTLGEQDSADIDVGILSRSSVHDIALHEDNTEFFESVGFVVLLEPSRLVTTAQLGLNSVVKLCKKKEQHLTFCSVDKNCDGLVDALSHILMTKIDEVTATNRHRGACSYMAWEVDGDHLQHRLVPNLAHYMGIGTELSFAALRNQVSRTYWYGGDVFPVKDIHWIAKQYYYDLLSYANLPANQEMMDSCFNVSANMWDATVMDNGFLIVEDEDFNIFELKRQYSTRVAKQSLINIISPNYLLRDYMNANNMIFDTDSKAIPYIVADYVRSVRNVALRIILRMCTTRVDEADIRNELKLIGIVSDNPTVDLWKLFCEFNPHIIAKLKLNESVINKERAYSYLANDYIEYCSIDNRRFIDVFAKDLQNASYIAEDENGNQEFIGPELRSHVLQKYLPGQFFTVDGRYYEMIGVAPDGQVLARRSADHITGRPCYRQVRNYKITNIQDSIELASNIETLGMRISHQYADISVETPAYWNMSVYNDFNDGNLVKVDGIPKREFYKKSFLRIDLENAPEKVVSTIALLMNEVFRTLFSNNADYIVAVTNGQHEKPFTYSLELEGATGANASSIYVIEDSQLDVGLLVAVERNLGRIFSIICDYLDWHIEEVEESKKPPKEDTKPVDYTISPEQADDENLTKIQKFFKKVKLKIKGFFGKIFKKRNSKPEEGTNDSEKKSVLSGIKGLFKKKKNRDVDDSAIAATDDSSELPNSGSEELPVSDDSDTEDVEAVVSQEDGSDEISENNQDGIVDIGDSEDGEQVIDSEEVDDEITNSEIE